MLHAYADLHTFNQTPELAGAEYHEIRYTAERYNEGSQGGFSINSFAKHYTTQTQVIEKTFWLSPGKHRGIAYQP